MCCRPTATKSAGGLRSSGGTSSSPYSILRLDGERDLTLFGRDTDIRTGIQLDTREAVGNGASFSIASFPSTVDVASFDTGEAWATGFDNTIGGTYYDNIGLRNAWAAAAGGLGIPGAADQLIEIEEDILAAYAMATTHFDGGNIVYGARVEMTDYTTAGPDLAIAYSDDYVNVLPSVHVNFDLRDDLKFRVSASTGLSRPTYTELRASAAVDPTSRTVSGGNPTLDPETTWGFDASLEWYFAPASLLSAGAFYRHVDDVIYVDSTTIDGGTTFGYSAIGSIRMPIRPASTIRIDSTPANTGRSMKNLEMFI